MGYRRSSSRMIFILKPFSIALLLFSIFAIVWLRSSIVSLEYNISNLEKKRIALMTERKTLAAERARLVSVERFKNVAAKGFTFPDRVKVVHVKRAGDKETYKASFVVDNNK
ncbi:MAG: hypothetical protein QMD01_00220 [Thermodesulfovibrionales bacterium]|nr:hypothetical protein [Thermodesulfovibrionales bacterium]